MVVRTDNKQSWHCNLLGLKQYISWFAASALVKHTGICFLNIVCIYFFVKVSYVLQFLRGYVVLTRMNLIVLNKNYIIGKVSRYICMHTTSYILVSIINFIWDKFDVNSNVLNKYSAQFRMPWVWILCKKRKRFNRDDTLVQSARIDVDFQARDR